MASQRTNQTCTFQIDEKQPVPEEACRRSKVKFRLIQIFIIELPSTSPLTHHSLPLQIGTVPHAYAHYQTTTTSGHRRCATGTGQGVPPLYNATSTYRTSFICESRRGGRYVKCFFSTSVSLKTSHFIDTTNVHLGFRAFPNLSVFRLRLSNVTTWHAYRATLYEY